MALVKTYHFDHATVEIMDDAYKDASPEEIKRRIKVMQDIAGEILYKAQMRKLMAREQKDGAQAPPA